MPCRRHPRLLVATAGMLCLASKRVQCWVRAPGQPRVGLRRACTADGGPAAKELDFAAEAAVYATQGLTVPPTTMDVLFADEDIVVVNKPAHLLTVPGREVKFSAATWVQAKFEVPRLDQMIVHRLDMATSGCLIFARNVESLRDLHQQFRVRAVRKEYLACCAGRPGSLEGDVRLPIRKDMENAPRMLVDHDDGKPSWTTWSLEGIAEAPELDEGQRSYLRLTPKTGRSHQLRIHMARIGLPILGDHFYASGAAREASDRLLLHAHSIAFRHPRTKADMHCRAPCEFWMR